MWDMNDIKEIVKINGRKIDDIKEINYKSEYVFHIVFDDGSSGDVDFSEYLSKGPIFRPLENMTFFRKAVIEGGTISWPNGADVAPETLYKKINP